MKTVTMCMAPIYANAGSPEEPNHFSSSRHASAFGLKIVEAPIVLDYLKETSAIVQNILTPQDSLFNDWWDTLLKKDYAKILARRHKNIHGLEKKLLSDKNLPWPDISTYKGLRPVRLAYGDVVGRKRQSGERNEFYEIKPNSKPGNRAAEKKIKDVQNSYLRNGLSGIYKPGEFYPQARKKKIYFSFKFKEIFLYLINIILPQFNCEFLDIYMQVERKFAGCLIYEICVKFRRPDNKKWREVDDWEVAAFCIRNFLRARTIGETDDTRKLAMAYADQLAPVGSDIGDFMPTGSVNGIDLKKVPMIKVRTEAMSSELEVSVMGLRDVMYSRLIGKPGERYFLCCDETYYQQAIRLRGIQKVESQINILKLNRTMKSAYASGSLPDIIQISAFAYKDVNNARFLLAKEAINFMVNHPKETIILVVIGLLVTGLLFLTIESDGLAAPFTAPTIGTLTETATGIVSATNTARTAVMATSVMADTAAVSTPVAAVSDAILVSETAGASSTQVPSIVTWARNVAEIGARAEGEVLAARAQSVIDEMLVKALSEGSKEAMKKAVVESVGGTAISVIGLSSTPAYASTTPTSNSVVNNKNSKDVKSNNLGPLVAQSPIGRLFLIKTKKAFPYPYREMPKINDEFEIDYFADQYKISSAEEKKASEKARLLGILWIE
ncbi:hypothetical protein [Bacillus sp. ME78]|uniref:hypothetical protein n=1 Tax=Bacillus sp. ME78 TaxID=2744261 RepID=UPI0015FF0427|nr:hypothetical protein [Bacillus sp. ME78]